MAGCRSDAMISGRFYRIIRSPLVMLAVCVSSLITASHAGCSSNGGVGTGSSGTMPGIRLDPVADGFDAPVQITVPEGDAGRLFVVEQPGRIWIMEDGQVQESPFLDIGSIIAYGGERGLLSLAFPPQGGGIDHFYVNYTRTGDGATVVACYSVDPHDPDKALEESAAVLMVVEQPYSNHNGGMMTFGPDGYLYIALGDGGGSGDPDGNGQDHGTLLGSILRIDVEGAVKPYGIPEDNPFVGAEGFREEIWAMGLRNPWRFSFDRRTGDMYIGDVGQNLWEEIDVQPAAGAGGENYGWNIMEGKHCYGADDCDRTGLILPVHEYGHDEGCSITGGYLYRGRANPGLRGVYIFGDYCSGRIWGLRLSGAEWISEELLDSQLRIVSFGEDSAGELYVVDLEGGIYLIRETKQ